MDTDSLFMDINGVVYKLISRAHSRIPGLPYSLVVYHRLNTPDQLLISLSSHFFDYFDPIKPNTLCSFTYCNSTPGPPNFNSNFDHLDDLDDLDPDLDSSRSTKKD